MAALERAIMIHQLSNIYNTFGADDEDKTVDEVWAEFLRDFLQPLGWIAKDDLCGRCVVTDIDFETLTATITHPVNGYDESLSSDEDESDDDEVKEIFSKLVCNEDQVPLERLVVNTKQPNGSTILRLQATAHLSVFRWFKRMLNWPEDTTNAKKWWSQNLKLRLQMWEDLTEGTIPEDQAREILNTISALRQNHIKLSNLYEEQEESTDTESNFEKSFEGLDEEVIMLEMEQERLKTAMKHFQQPAVRATAYRLKLAESNSIVRFESFLENVILVADSGVFSSYDIDSFTDELHSHISQEGKPDKINIRIAKSLAGALLGCRAHSTIYLPEGTHYIAGLCNLERGGSIIGMGERGKTILKPRGAGDVWLQTKENVTFRNLTVIVEIPTMIKFCGVEVGRGWKHPETCFQALGGRLWLERVNITGPSKDLGFAFIGKPITGIHIQNGAGLIGELVELSKFTKGVLAEGSGGIDYSSISHCEVGFALSVSEDTESERLSVKKCSIENCEYGVRLECGIDTDQVGNETLLQQRMYPIHRTDFISCVNDVILVPVGCLNMDSEFPSSGSANSCKPAPVANSNFHDGDLDGDEEDTDEEEFDLEDESDLELMDVNDNKLDVVEDENDALRDENDAVEDENDALRDENDAVEDENNALRDENDAVDGNDVLGDENNVVGDQNDVLGNENDVLGNKNDVLGN